MKEKEKEKEKKTDLLQGTLDLLVLKALALGPLHGLGVSNRIAQVTQGVFQVKPGSLFPALHRMEEAGWLTSSWGGSEKNRRAKDYRLAKAGQRQLKTETEDWQRISLAIAKARQATSEEKHATNDSSIQSLAQPVPQGKDGTGTDGRDRRLSGDACRAEYQRRSRSSACAPRGPDRAWGQGTGQRKSPGGAYGISVGDVVAGSALRAAN